MCGKMKRRVDKMKRIFSFLPGCKGSNNNRDNSRGGGIISLAGVDFLGSGAFQGDNRGARGRNQPVTRLTQWRLLAIISPLSLFSFFYLFILSL